MGRSERSRTDEAADEIARLLFGGEIDGRWRALLAAANFTQIGGLAEPALRLADQQNCFAGVFEADRNRLSDIVEDADSADAGVGKIHPSGLSL